MEYGGEEGDRKTIGGMADDRRSVWLPLCLPQRWCLVTAVFIAQVLGAMYVSFNICMAVGIFTMLIVLTPKKTGKALLANLVFTAAFIVFFQVFFTNIMHIYFPEPFFG